MARALPNRFDVSAKELVELRPLPLLRAFGLNVQGPVTAIDPQISTLATSSDKVFVVEQPSAGIVALEFLSRRQDKIHNKLLLRQVGLRVRHQKPTQTVVVLQCRAADGPEWAGPHDEDGPDGSIADTSHCRVVRLWTLALDPLLQGDPALLPLASLTDEAADKLDQVMPRVIGRIDSEVPPAHNAMMVNTAFLMMGLRYKDEVAVPYFEGVRAMEESSTFQWILRKGEGNSVVKARARLLELATPRLGPPDEAVRERVEQINDLDSIVDMVFRAGDPSIGNWEDVVRS